jgi:hypothetical protein
MICACTSKKISVSSIQKDLIQQWFLRKVNVTKTTQSSAWILILWGHTNKFIMLFQKQNCYVTLETDISLRGEFTTGYTRQIFVLITIWKMWSCLNVTHKIKHVQCTYFPENWILWGRGGHLTCRIILQLGKHGNFAVAECTTCWQQTS